MSSDEFRSYPYRGTAPEKMEYVKGNLKLRLSNAAKELESVKEEKRAEVYEAQMERAEEAEKVSNFFKSVKDNPCPSCKTHCCKSAEASGYHKGIDDIHPDLINDPELLLSFIVPLREEEMETKEVHHLNYDVKPPALEVAIKDNMWKEDRCVFLSPTGCNIPPKYRSLTCLGFRCSDLNKAINEPRGPMYSTGPSERLFQLGKKIHNNTKKPWRYIGEVHYF